MQSMNPTSVYISYYSAVCLHLLRTYGNSSSFALHRDPLWYWHQPTICFGWHFDVFPYFGFFVLQLVESLELWKYSGRSCETNPRVRHCSSCHCKKKTHPSEKNLSFCMYIQTLEKPFMMIFTRDQLSSF